MQQDFEAQKKHVTYGSIISIAHASDPDAYIFANGFSRNNITVKNLDKLNNAFENPGQAKENKFFFSSCLFLITPIFSNNLKQDALAFIKRSLEIKNLSTIERQDSFVEQHLEEISVQKLNQTKTKVISEYKSNMEIYKKFKGKPISFNQSFQLIHLESCKYLACYDQEAEHEKENFLLQLDEHPSEHSIFKVTPAFKYQKDAEQTIEENETVLINHVNRSFRKEVYLHASEELSTIHKKLANKSGSSKMKEKHISMTMLEEQKPGGVLLREANASIDQKTFWKFHIFSSEFEEDSECLQSGDVIWLYHSELNASLTARKKQESFQLFHLKRKNNNESQSPTKPDETPIEFIKNHASEEKFEDFIGNTCGVWVIEAVDYKKGEKIQYGENFRLKHMITGKYLIVRKDDAAKRLKLALQELNSGFEAEESHQKNTYFSFFPISSLLTASSTKQIPINSFTYIRNVYSKKWLDAVVCQSFKEDEDGEFEVKIDPCLKDHFTEQEIFRVRKVPSDLIWQLKFLNSYYPTLKNFYGRSLKANVL